MTTRADPVGMLRERATAAVSKHVRPGQRVALVDVPTHSNVGDSAIWLGELAAFDALGVRPRYFANLDTFSAARLRERIGGGTVFLHGGGNLGDLWPRHQRHREEVIRALPDNPIVQLPQSVEFSRAENRERARKVMREHPALTVLVRDHRSLGRVRAELDVPAQICPDLAVCLGPLARPKPSGSRGLWLLREDREAAGHESPPEGVARVDWLDEELNAATWVARRLKPRLGQGRPGRPLTEVALARAWRIAAARRVARGRRLLGQAPAVVTDRLHAHLLCLLMGIPHVVLPDRFGKIDAFLDSWTGGLDGVHRCSTPAKARDVLRRLLDQETGVRS